MFTYFYNPKLTDIRVDIHEIKSWEHWKDGQLRVRLLKDCYGKDLEHCLHEYTVKSVHETKAAAIAAFAAELIEKLKAEDKFFDHPEIIEKEKEKQQRVEANKKKYFIDKNFKFPFGKYAQMSCKQVIDVDRRKGLQYIDWFINEVGASVHLKFYSELSDDVFKSSHNGYGPAYDPEDDIGYVWGFPEY